MVYCTYDKLCTDIKIRTSHGSDGTYIYLHIYVPY